MSFAERFRTVRAALRRLTRFAKDSCCLSGGQFSLHVPRGTRRLFAPSLSRLCALTFLAVLGGLILCAQAVPPKKQSNSSKKQASSPKKQASPPKKQAGSPKKQASSPKKEVGSSEKPAGLPQDNVGARQKRPSQEIRALWVARWDYHTAADVEKIARNAASLGCNRLFFQVRGEATCFFPSRVEPWAWELSEGGVESTGSDPGWDPLQTAIEKAHECGLELHAYMNVLPAWKQEKSPPQKSGHVFAAHPDWIMVDARGRRMSPAREKFYAFLNPALPQVRMYLARVYADVAMRYPALDGIHLDYIRYPGEVGNYSFDKISLSEFGKFSGGRAPKDAPDKWNQWRAAQINLLLSDLSRAIRGANPSLEISAAVAADYQSATENKGQRWLAWPDLGLVDAVVPMAYHYDDKAYLSLLGNFLGARRPRQGKVVVGVWPAEKWREKGYDMTMLGHQIALAREMGADGISLFSYSVFFPDHKPNAWAAYVRKNCFSDTVLSRSAR